MYVRWWCSCNLTCCSCILST